MKNKFGYFGSVLILIVLLSGCSSPTTTSNSNDNVNQAQEESSAEPTEVVEENMVVDLAEFVSEFDKNQLAAETKYEKKMIETTGYVGNISEDVMGSFFIILNPTNEEFFIGTAVQCYFENKEALTSLEKGQQVTVEGRFDSQLMNILVKNCSLK
jgi:hypothetical protein